MSMDMKAIGEYAKKARKAMGLTQADLALASGVGMRFISEFERGKASCQLGKGLQLLAALGIRVELKSKRELA